MMIKQNKRLALSIVLILVVIFRLNSVYASDEEVNDQTLQQETEEALRAENEQLEQLVMEQEDDIITLDNMNSDLYGQLMVYRDQVNQMSANQEREYYMEDE